MAEQIALQVLKALAFYVGVIVLLRFSGKRLAGQTTTFDLIVLITMGVVLQSVTLQPGTLNALVFVATVFAAHRLLSWWCATSQTVRYLVRGKPRVLVRDGQIVDGALDKEGMSEEEMLAGLRKLGHENVRDIKLAVLEETGHVSAVARE